MDDANDEVVDDQGANNDDEEQSKGPSRKVKNEPATPSNSIIVIFDNE